MNNLPSAWAFFNTPDKRKLSLLFVAILCLSGFEMLGVASIFPFISVLANPEVTQHSKILGTLYSLGGFQSERTFILFLGAGVLGVLAIGNVFSAFTYWMMLKFCYTQGKKLSLDLLRKYLSQDYLFFLNRHTSELEKNLLIETDRWVNGVLSNGLQLLTKLVIILAIFLLLCYVDWGLALCVFSVLGIAYLGIYKKSRQKILRAGEQASQLNTARIRLIQEVLGGIKELKVLGREQKFVKDFQSVASDYIKVETFSQLSPLITKYLIETLAFGGIILIALYLIGAQKDIHRFLPLLSLYALAGYRLMPALHQAFSCLSAIKYHDSALVILQREMQLSSHQWVGNQGVSLPFQKEVKLEKLSYAYSAGEKQVIKQLDLTIARHTTIGIVGLSGAGKSTLIDIILGLLTPQQGKLLVDEVVIGEQNCRAWQRNIGYVPQHIFLLEGSVADNIALGVSPPFDEERVKTVIELANATAFVQRLPEGYHTKIGERGVRLSGGQRQRLGIARALYHDPELLIFDEATNSLDGMTESGVMDAIHKLASQKTIILVAHRLNTVKQCDVIYMLREGEVVGKGSYAELMQSNRYFQNLANLPMLENC